ncbi:sugar transferase [Moorella sp. Hama-1]|uniref:sugar transferase n=1 Tax=Moorella sp. Hama-1 TaxID=2138101 RepID=UPI000D647724|nr:sugar transferase [Moorella sp. Hama-1]BCV20673.1 glycosyl transferase [Moorella sp. Hama-1]
MAKRAFDIAFSIIGLIVLFPLMLLITVLIKIDSPGPVFYRGLRTGLHGKPFRMLKFRTMVPNADQLGGPSTGKNDPRITRVGRFLRRYKLDEIPQLFNVLKGEMSIVGPRPEVPQYTKLYTGDELIILSVRPGITDYSSIMFAQLGEVLGDDDPDRVYEEKVRPIKNALRVKYVKECCFLVDLKILFMTILRLLGVKISGIHLPTQYRSQDFKTGARM